MARRVLAPWAALSLAAACGGDRKPPPAPPQTCVDCDTRVVKDAWPVSNVTYGEGDGILEQPVVAMTTDEGQNRWVATRRALYLLRPGDEKFTRFDETSGLHLGMMTGLEPGPVGWAKYCDNAPVADDAPCGGTVTWGGAALNGIQSLAGGEADEVFVGYGGTHADPAPLCPDDPGYRGYDWCDPFAHSGKIDWVRLKRDGTLEVVRFDLVTNQMGARYWHDRLMYRLVYDHEVNARTLYSASEHGITMLLPDRYRAPRPGEWFDLAYSEYMGDHLHARVCRFDPPAPCPADSEEGQRMGGWHGLAIDAQGRLWHAGKWTAGRITWHPDPHVWVFRNGAAFDAAFGDPYDGPGTGNPPVFEVAAEGHEPRMTGVAVCPDGRVWFTSEGAEDGPARDRGDVLAAWDGRRFAYFTGPQIGLAESRARDVACLPDGRVVVAGFTTGLAIFDPAKGTSKTVRASSGLIPSDAIRQLELYRLMSPPTLQVATDGGAAALRVLP
ncbi:MAG TPA: WD40 repeat domain-containing protein [Anaeromyxobacter sp.]|nr:WD40 repeat domain-containing protein [Anaeromyxobacter sp.]